MSTQQGKGFPEGDVEDPEVLIWAAGGYRKEMVWPLPEWKPNIIIDLNYTANSPAIEYSKKVGARYISGKEMFKLQALNQQKVWTSFSYILQFFGYLLICWKQFGCLPYCLKTTLPIGTERSSLYGLCFLYCTVSYSYLSYFIFLEFNPFCEQ
ncbi:MAG: hypothetical protein R2827_12190 [Bdellovibrionales bacterium]